MRVRKLSSTGDYTFGANQLNFFIDDAEGVGQLVKTSLLLWLGEWYLNMDIGVPYLQGIIGKHSQAQADATLRLQILDVTVINDQGDTVQAVISIDNFSSEIDPMTRKYSSLTATLNTIYGPTELQVSNYVNF